jgi:ABC-type branched-subunit amino acid transport system ATPase component
MRLTGIGGVSRRLTSNLTLAEGKKLCLAMALLGNPDLLLLDEPMMGLNDTECLEMRELIGMLGERKTVLLFSSDYDTVVPLSDTLVLLSSGQILAADVPEILEARLSEQGEVSSLRDLYTALCGASEEDADQDDPCEEEVEKEDAE